MVNRGSVSGPIFLLLLISFLVGSLLAGCYTTRVTYEDRYSDSNSVASFLNPEFETVRSTSGYGLLVAGTVAGGVVGYSSGVKIAWRSDQPPSEKAFTNGVLGGLLGLASSWLIEQAYRPDDILLNSETAPRWIALLDERLRYLSLEDGYDMDYLPIRRLTAISDSGDRQYTPTDRQSLANFLSWYPNSPFRNDVLLRAAGRFPRADLPIIFQSFPGTPAADSARKRFVSESGSLLRLLQSLSDYPDLAGDMEVETADSVRTYDEASAWLALYPESDRGRIFLNRLDARLDWQNIMELARRTRSDTIRLLLADRALQRARTMPEIVSTLEVAPSLHDRAYDRGLAVASSPEDLRIYLAAFPSSPYRQDLSRQLDLLLTEPENLGPGINTDADEYGPVISPDGETLWFTRRGDRHNRGGKEDEDIWAALAGPYDSWMSAINVRDLNDSYPNGVNSVLPDGNTIFLHGTGGRGIESPGSIAHRTERGWSRPEPVILPGFQNDAPYQQAFLANDGQTLLVAIQKSGGKGKHDLYVSQLDDNGRWGELKNLGTSINTSESEESPFLASDMRTLYFTSAGHGGEGGLDMFVARRRDESWTNWSKPVNLGRPINTVEDENFLFLPASGEIAYFSSDRSGAGQNDLFRVRLAPEVRPTPVVLVRGEVRDGANGEPVGTTIWYEDLTSGVEAGRAHSDPATGSYMITLPAGRHYGIRAEADGYYPVTDHVDLEHLTTYEELTIDLTPVRLEDGARIPLNNLFFTTGSRHLLRESFPELNRLAAFLRENSEFSIMIEGYTDGTGGEEDNLRLSEERADEVRTYLAGRGVAVDRMTFHGWGETGSVDTVSDSRRRRVDIILRTNANSSDD